jgi:hypothetical protein
MDDTDAAATLVADISRAVADLACSGLVIDLRGNSGGGIGCLRVMSHLCPDRRGVGYSVGRALARKGYDKERLPQFDRISNEKPSIIDLDLGARLNRETASEDITAAAKLFYYLTWDRDALSADFKKVLPKRVDALKAKYRTANDVVEALAELIGAPDAG